MQNREPKTGIAVAASLALLALGCGGSQKGLEHEGEPETGEDAIAVLDTADGGTPDSFGELAGERDAGADAVEPKPPPSHLSDFDDPLGGGRPRRREPPAEVTEDKEYIDEEFFDPDGDDAAELAVRAKTLLRAIPPRDRRDAEDEILGQTDEETGTIKLRGAFLDAEKTLFVTRYHYGVVEAVYLLLDGEGKLLHKLVVELRNGVYLKDVVGDGTLELMISVVHGNALSAWPTSWRIYEVSGRRLRKIGQVAKSYSDGSKYERYYFLNRVEFPDKGEMVVRTVLYSGGRSDLAAPPKGAPTWEGARDEYTYEPARRKFAKTSSAKRPKRPDKKHGSPEPEF